MQLPSLWKPLPMIHHCARRLRRTNFLCNEIWPIFNTLCVTLLELQGHFMVVTMAFMTRKHATYDRNSATYFRNSALYDS